METIISANLENREPIKKGEIKMGEEIEKKITEVSEPPAAVPQIAPVKKYTAELIGTMVLVLIGCGSAVIAGQYIRSFRNRFCFRSISIGNGLRNRQHLWLPHKPRHNNFNACRRKNKRKRHNILHCVSML